MGPLSVLKNSKTVSLQYSTVHTKRKKGYLFVVLYHLWVWATVSHLSDLLTHQREQPDVEQQLASRGRALEINHQHHSKQEEEGKIKYNVPVKFNLWGGVQVHQPGPAAQRLHGLQAVDRKITAVRETMPCFHVSTVYSTSNDIKVMQRWGLIFALRNKYVHTGHNHFF